MFGVCRNCGAWTLEKDVSERAAYAVATCPDCGHEVPFRSLPLLVVTGASGTGKSTLLRELVRDAVTGRDDTAERVVPLESDTLWELGSGLAIEAYARLWQRVCAGIHQSGRPTLLFGAGLNPENMEPVETRRYFRTIRYLALVADGDDLTERLRARPDWRESADPEFVAEQVAYNRRLRTDEVGPDSAPVETLNTSGRSVRESVEELREWIRGALDAT